METRLKQRLTGAAILVALVVLLVPEMFRGQHAPVATSASSGGEGPPMRSYFIDLSNAATRTAPLQSTPASSGGSDDKPMPAAPMPPAAPDHPVPNGAAPAAASSSTAPMTASAASPSPAPAVIAPAPSHHATASAPALSRAAAPSTSANAPAHARTESTPAYASASGGWGVQLGLFAKRDNAERLVRAAQDKGFSVSVANPDARGLYRVYAGGMADRIAAEAYSQRLKDQGLPAAVVSLP
ncbi:MAG TPA: SPOR domain-containing protein [Steroidobacteraceae bacterium]|jgi:cell division septation protein DedD